LATVHARDNQPTNDQRRHDTAYLNKRLFYWRKVRRLKTSKKDVRTLTAPANFIVCFPLANVK